MRFPEFQKWLWLLLLDFPTLLFPSDPISSESFPLSPFLFFFSDAGFFPSTPPFAPQAFFSLPPPRFSQLVVAFLPPSLLTFGSNHIFTFCCLLAVDFFFPPLLSRTWCASPFPPLFFLRFFPASFFVIDGPRFPSFLNFLCFLLPHAPLLDPPFPALSLFVFCFFWFLKVYGFFSCMLLLFFLFLWPPPDFATPCSCLSVATTLSFLCVLDLCRVAPVNCSLHTSTHPPFSSLFPSRAQHFSASLTGRFSC